VVILGAGGFVGGSTLRHLKAHQNQTLALGRPGLDLLAPDAATKLATALRPDDALVFVSALAPCKNATMLLDNLRMAEVVSTALAQSPVAHAVYVSSDAVYADSPHPLAESSCAEPGSIHGVMHLAREVVMKSITTIPLAIVRPTLVYGLDDPHNGYGPNRFRRLAANGETIKLFGEGEERRDHVAVEDVAELIRLLLGRRSTGAVNATSGAVVSFRELAETAIAAFSSGSKIVGSPRSGLMPHNGYRPFAPSAALLAFPGFAFRSWQDGYAANCAATPSA
jgi:nucleoside-diphosphate-sugar epimerase